MAGMPSSNAVANDAPPRRQAFSDSGAPTGVRRLAAPRRALVIDDEAAVRASVCLQLGMSGYDCVAAPDGQGGLELARHELFDLIVLDLLMPGLDGISVCRAIREDATNSDTPILMLTARREKARNIFGLESGADDCLDKPFSERELVAHAGALTRRLRSTPVPTAPTQRRVEVCGLTVDLDRRRVTVGDRHVDLTPKEFSLIFTLASCPGIVFSRTALLGEVWRGEAFVSERSVDEVVKRVRHKLERACDGRRYIVTVWGTGYKLSDD
jgi:DNA-binding response OmpR family regulator